MSIVQGVFSWVPNRDDLERNELSAFFLLYLNPSNWIVLGFAQRCLVLSVSQHPKGKLSISIPCWIKAGERAPMLQMEGTSYFLFS